VVDDGQCLSLAVAAQALGQGESLRPLLEAEGASDLLLGTRDGWAIRFREENVRPMGRTARGVRGIKLRQGSDEVVGMAVIPRDVPSTLATSYHIVQSMGPDSGGPGGFVAGVDPVHGDPTRARQRVAQHPQPPAHEALAGLAEYRLLFFGGLLLVVLWAAPARQKPRSTRRIAAARTRSRDSLVPSRWRRTTVRTRGSAAPNSSTQPCRGSQRIHRRKRSGCCSRRATKEKRWQTAMSHCQRAAASRSVVGIGMPFLNWWNTLASRLRCISNSRTVLNGSELGLWAIHARLKSASHVPRR
jgi:DNA gyrase/topoisomerase IV subunit A